MSAYSPEQVAQYLQVIGIPPSLYPDAVPAPARDVQLLKTLFIHQISTIPYENLQMHYSQNKNISIDPQVLFDKIITRHQYKRGGYCYEVAIPFYNILLAYGFNVYMTGVRTRLRPGGIPQGLHMGWRHLLSIIALENGEKWVCDVAFGGDGPTAPMKLEDSYTLGNLGTQEVRLRYDFVPDMASRAPEHRLWVYEYRNGPEQPWHQLYCFADIPFFTNDFEACNFEVYANPTAWMRFAVLAIRFIPNDTKDAIVGKIMLATDSVKQNMGGKTQVVKQLTTEAERVEAIKEYFGIHLTPEEIEGIKGTSVALA